MKLLCINAKDPKMADCLQPEHWLVEGEVYTFYASFVYEGDGLEYYFLQEKLYDQLVAYRADRFLPLSDIDESMVHEEMAECQAIGH